MNKLFLRLFTISAAGLLLYGVWYRQTQKINFSVIIPVYNAEKFLPRCLDSIFAQSGDFEVITVNDGSTDKSLEVLQDYQKKHSNIKIIDQKNQGLSVARNVGMSYAKNKYLTFVDNDDWLEPNTFKKAEAAIKQDAPDILLTGFYDVYDREWVRKLRGDEEAAKVPEESKYPNRMLDKLSLFSPFYGKDAYSDLFYEGGGVRARFFKRDFIEQYKIDFPNGIGEDTSFTFRAYLHNPLISVLNIPVYNYRNRLDSASKSYRVLEESRQTLWQFQQTPEYKNAGRRLQMLMNDSWLFLTILGLSNLQRYGAPYGTGFNEAYAAYKTFSVYNSEELKGCRNFQKLRKILFPDGY